MKKRMIFAAFAVVVAIFASCDDEKIISESGLPVSSQNFIKTHFPGVAVAHVIIDRDSFGKSYTVYLINGFELEFERNGDWDKVDGYAQAVPQSILNLIPAGIVEHITNFFPNLEIVAIDKERFGYEIYLTGRRFELKFNHSGNFIGIDD